MHGLALKLYAGLLHLVRGPVNLDRVVVIESNMDLLQVLADLLDASHLPADDVLVKPGGASHALIANRVGLLVHLVQGHAQLGPGSPQSDRLGRVVIGWHLFKHPSLGENLVDGVSIGSDDVAVLGLLHLNRDVGELLIHLLPHLVDVGA